MGAAVLFDIKAAVPAITKSVENLSDLFLLISIFSLVDLSTNGNILNQTKNPHKFPLNISTNQKKKHPYQLNIIKKEVKLSNIMRV